MDSFYEGENSRNLIKLDKANETIQKLCEAHENILLLARYPDEVDKFYLAKQVSKAALEVNNKGKTI